MADPAGNSGGPAAGTRAVIRAAGAVVWRPGRAGREVALVHRPRYDDWSHPKGKCEPGEHVLATAVREVAEETGLRVALGRPLKPSVYQTVKGLKHVRYWVARCVGTGDFVPGHEVDEVRWLPLGQARRQLSRDQDIALLDEMESAPVDTVPVILLRHAEAGRKPERLEEAGREVAAEDLARPLDLDGAADASALAGLLASYGRCRVVSSAAERCTATVQPYAKVAGVPVEVESTFTVLHGSVSRARAARTRAGERCAARIAASGTAAVICAHRENLPGLIAAACRALGAPPPEAAPLRKGEFWVLQTAGGALVSAERHAPAE